MSTRAEIEIVLSNGQTAGKSINELTAQSVKLSREIKKMEIGSAEYVKATEDYQKVAGRLKNVKTEVFNTSKAQGLLNSEMGQFIPFNAQLGKFIGTYSSLSSGIKAATGAQKLLNLAIAASGIGLLVLAVVSLKAAFTSSEEGQNKWIKMMGVINMLLGNGMDLLADIGEKLIWVFENPRQAIEKFATLIKDQIVNRFIGMMELIPKVGEVIGLLFEGKFSEAGEVAANAVGKVSLGVENMTDKIKAGTKATKEFIEEQKRETAQAKKVADMRAKADIIDRGLMVEKAKIQSEINELKLKARQEEEYGAADRKKFILEAQGLETQLLDKEKEALILRSEAQSMENTFSRSNKENLDKEAAAKAAVYQIEATRLEQQRATQRELNRVNKELRKGEANSDKEREKEHKEQLKRIKEQEEALKKLKEAQSKFVEDSLKAELKGIEDRKKLDAEMLEGVKAQRQLDFDNKLTQLTTMNEAEQRMINELFLTNQLEQEERDRMLYDSQKKALEDRLALLLANGQQSSQAYQEIYMNLLQLQYDHEQKQTAKTKEEEDKRKAIRDAGLATAAGVFAGLAQLLSENSKHRRKNLNAIKAAQVAEIAINTATEIQSIWKNANTFPVPLNGIIGAVQTALALARAKGAINRVNAVQIEESGQAFAEGGVVHGPSHQAGGVPFGVKGSGVRHEMEGGEIILNKGVFQNPVLRALASDINVMGGGRSFALGGPVLQDRGFLPNNSSGTTTGDSGQAMNNFARMSALLEEIAINTRDTADKPTLALTEVRRGLNALNEVEQDARF